MLMFIALTLCSTSVVSAVGGGRVTRQPIAYTSGSRSVSIEGKPRYALTGANYEYTGFGAAESSIDVSRDGNLIYTPAFSGKKVGYAISKDEGKSWEMVVPDPNQPRQQPMFTINDGRYFFWSSNMPGFKFSYSDDQGMTWTKVSDHVQPASVDWAKMISGKPVRSQLNNASSILYLSAPSTVSVTITPGVLGPIRQAISKSVDGGKTWKATLGSPTLSPILNGGPCAAFTKGKSNDEYIIWSNGLVRPNGTIMFGLRRCRTASIAISDDEGDTWRYSDIPGSSFVPYTLGLGTWVKNGNVLVSEPITQDLNGNLYSIWVDENYILKMARSQDNAATWSKPIILSAPVKDGIQSVMSYHPKLIHHPTTQGRAAIAYYGSSDGGKTWHGYVAETGNLGEENPVFSSIIVNEEAQPLQRNVDGMWDQGYRAPFEDLVEFLGLTYHPKTGDLIAAFTRKMCSQYLISPASFNTSSCVDGWDFHRQDNATWQGYVAIVRH